MATGEPALERWVVSVHLGLRNPPPDNEPSFSLQLVMEFPPGMCQYAEDSFWADCKEMFAEYLRVKQLSLTYYPDAHSETWRSARPDEPSHIIVTQYGPDHPVPKYTITNCSPPTPKELPE